MTTAVVTAHEFLPSPGDIAEHAALKLEWSKVAEWLEADPEGVIHNLEQAGRQINHTRTVISKMAIPVPHGNRRQFDAVINWFTETLTEFESISAALRDGERLSTEQVNFLLDGYWLAAMVHSARAWKANRDAS